MTNSTHKTIARITAPVLALGLALPMASSPALAGEETEIQVVSPKKMEQWKADVSRQLDRALVRAPGRASVAPSAGIVQIAFELDEEGNPDNLKVYSNSADYTAMRMAKYAVTRIDGLDEAPVTNVGEAQFLANIIFANNRAQHDELALTLAQSERTRLAAGPEENEVIVLGG